MCSIEQDKKEIVECRQKLDGTDVDYYNNAAKYWEGVDGTVNGMLGGFGKVSDVDIDGSNKFLKTLFKVSIFSSDIFKMKFKGLFSEGKWTWKLESFGLRSWHWTHY